MLPFVAFVLVGLFFRRICIFYFSPFPGPILPSLSKLYAAYVAHTGKAHVWYTNLHRRYGPVVRVGPNEVSVIDPELVPNILHGLPKGPMWDGRRILPSKKYNRNNSLTAVPDLRRHAQLRRPWNAAFKPDALAAYEPLLVARTLQLTALLSAQQTTTVDLTRWISYFTLDFMGDFAFGGVYSLMAHGDTDDILTTMQKGVYLPSITQHVPWLATILRAIPGIGSHLRAFGQFGVIQARKRMAPDHVVPYKDLCHYLLEAHSQISPDTPPLSVVTSSALLAIVAGSDTTASALSNTLFYLLTNPSYLTHVLSEINSSYPPSTPNEAISPSSTTPNASPDNDNNLTWLNACISESLRLQPPVPSGIQKSIPLGTGGIHIGKGVHLPEGTAILVPPCAMHRYPAYFPHPDDFLPERWLPGNEHLLLNKAAYIPFSMGTASCPGKPLAMMQLRYALVILLRSLSFELVGDVEQVKKQWEGDLEDRFIFVRGKLEVKVTPRIVT